MRTIPSTYKVAKSLISLLTAYDWRQFIVITGGSTTWREAAQDFIAQVNQYGFKVIQQVEFTEPYLTHAASWKSIVKDTHDHTRSKILKWKCLGSHVHYDRTNMHSNLS